MAKLCTLCKVNVDLQRSHIIPEFFYKMVYGTHPWRLRVIMYTFFVGSHPLPSAAVTVSLNKRDELIVMDGDAESFPFL